jgi:gas vesicle protein
MAKDNNTFAIFLAGLGIGVFGTLLLAPLSGKEARTRIRRAAGKTNKYLKKRTATLVDQAGGAINELTDKTKGELHDAAAAAKKTADKIVEKSRDLAHSGGDKLQEAGKRLQAV